MSFPIKIRSAAALQRLRVFITARAYARALEARAAVEASRAEVAVCRARLDAIEAESRSLRARLDAPEARRDIGRAAAPVLRRLAGLEAAAIAESEAMEEAEGRVKDALARVSAAQAEALRAERRLANARARRRFLATRWEAALDDMAADDIAGRGGAKKEKPA